MCTSYMYIFYRFQTIGIDSEFCIVESLVTGIVDMFPGYLRPRRRQFTTCVCVVLFLLGAPMTMEGGAYLFQLMDFYREEREADNMKFDDQP